MRITVLDTETTGLVPGDVVEIAAVTLTAVGEEPTKWRVGNYFTALVRPSCPISFEAMAAHHLTSEMVADAPTRAELAGTSYFGLDNFAPVVAAHNAAFDRQFLPELADRRWLCTYRCALHLWPDAPSHSNQVLRYYLSLDVADIPADAGSTPHRALYDAWCTAKLLERMLSPDGENRTVDELLELSVKPVVLRECRFGKHRGRNWDQVPRDYLSWILKQDGMDADVLHTARHHLGMLV